MSNCTGVIYGKVQDSGGSPISGVDVSLNFLQRADGGELRVGGDDLLTTFVPRATTTKAGEYIIPLFWESTQVPGSIASALAMRWGNNMSYSSQNQHGLLEVGLDLRKLLGFIFPPIPSTVPGAANMFLRFYIAASKELQGLNILRRFTGSIGLLSTELQGCYSRIDFRF
jgi:hypothetical protein